MTGSPEYLQRLLGKQERSLKECLAEAIKDNKIKNQYEPPPRHHEKETSSDFAERLARNAVSHQFVPVVFNGESHHVVFGVAGPLITRHGNFFLVPARVVDGRWGIHYFIFSPNFEAVLKAEEVFIRIDSGCSSGQLFGDITCDCREQLEVSFRLAAH